jgi:formylglycine-generating enzyme required for sulfatase activity
MKFYISIILCQISFYCSAQLIPVIKPEKKPETPSKTVPASPTKTSTPRVSYATIKFISDADGILYIDGGKRGNLEKGKPLRINLQKGDYLFRVDGADGLDNIKWNYNVDETGTEKIQEIGLQEIINQRLQAEQLRKEQELIEQKKKEQQIAEQKRKEAALAEQERIQRLLLVDRNEVEVALGIEMIKVGNFADFAIGKSDITQALVGNFADFAIGKYEVTQALWKAIMGNNPSNRFGDNLPVELVSWNDVQDFLKKLNQRTGKRYRLPTEVEWEYAARGGQYNNGYEYAGSNDIGEVAWYRGNSGLRTHEVGQKQPNALGIYDMSGNVWEWCSDWSDKKKRYNIVRGGGCGDEPAYSRVAGRLSFTPDRRLNSMGFRLALSL